MKKTDIFHTKQDRTHPESHQPLSQRSSCYRINNMMSCLTAQLA
ncbi:hypothetical protein RSPO_m00562 (plasmid) [Ralstonia solanacearum Po82]|uniref:Uncharacterized protein n=1 Tax=Ralstonia solanacearum (strain Po82) TaxID=1031711 RepID=F6G7S2_RALS8|nr:hypothetical protein RSPO_m00562 [Ralstonia solanacearum Po82]